MLPKKLVVSALFNQSEGGLNFTHQLVENSGKVLKSTENKKAPIYRGLINLSKLRETQKTLFDVLDLLTHLFNQNFQLYP